MKKTVTIGILLITSIHVIAQIYNPDRAVEYAQFWCGESDGRRNTASSPYYDPNKWGGPYNVYGVDCANFVSQCLIYGGLDLSLGAYGVPGGTGEVDNKGCIKGANELKLHFENHRQDTEYGYYPSIHGRGDPMLLVDEFGIATHAMFSSGFIQENRRLYCAHSNDRCDHGVTLGNSTYLFHIKSDYPDHCFNCKKDEDKGETDIDCGGPCPPCEHAPKHKSFTTPTDNLPTVARAIEKITAGNAAVRVLSGQDVSFHTLGTIELLPGFEARSGSNFNAVIKNGIYEVTADCNEYCEPTIYTLYDRWCPWIPGNGTFWVEVANVLKIHLEVYRRYNSNYIIDDIGELVYSNLVENQEGLVGLWDLIEGESSEYLQPDNIYHKYWAYLKFYPCEWGGEKYWFYSRKFAVKNDTTAHKMVKYELPNDLDRMNQILHTDINNVMYPEINTTLNFIIIPNPGTFQIESSFPHTDIGNLKIINSLRGTIYETQSLSSNTIQLPTSATGTFFVVIILKDGAVLTQKMVVQR